MRRTYLLSSPALIRNICFVRGKDPTEEMLALAEESNIVVFKTEFPMFHACGKLYEAGIKGNDQAKN